MMKNRRLLRIPIRFLVAPLLTLFLALPGSNSSGGGGEGNLNSDLFGNYLFHQIGIDGSGTVFTSQVSITANGDGTGNFSVLRDSSGAAGASGTFTYTVSMDHTFTVNNGSGTDTGVLSNDASLILVVDAEVTANDTDGESIVSIGIRKDCSSPPLLSGTYRLGQIGVDHSGIPDLIESKLVEITITTPGNGNFNVLKDSGGPGGFGDFSYSIGADCTIVVNNGSGDDFGIVSADGSRFVLVDADRGAVDSDFEIALIVGIQQNNNVGNGHFVGNYWLGQAGVDSTFPANLYTAKLQQSSAGSGSATTAITAHSEISPPGPPTGLTYTVDSSTGIMTLSDGTKTDDGMIDAAGELTFSVDTDPADGTIHFNSGVLY